MARKFRQWCELRVEWSNPYTDPPAGRPRILWAACLLGSWRPEDVDAVVPCARCPRENARRCGYVVIRSIEDDRPIRPMAPETKARLRLKRFKDRVQHKAPLFAELYIRERLRTRPELYDPEAIRREDERLVRSLQERERARIEAMTRCFAGQPEERKGERR